MVTTYAPSNQNAIAGRISRESSITYRDGTEPNRDVAAHDNMRASYQRTRQGQLRPASGPARQPRTQPTPPHPSPPPPFACGRLGAGKNTPSQILCAKTKPEKALSALCIAMFPSVYTTGGLCIAGFTQFCLLDDLFCGFVCKWKLPTPTHPVFALSDYPPPPCFPLTPF